LTRLVDGTVYEKYGNELAKMPSGLKQTLGNLKQGDPTTYSMLVFTVVAGVAATKTAHPTPIASKVDNLAVAPVSGMGALDNVITSRLATYADEVRSVISSQSGGLGRRFRRGGGNIAVSELQIGDDIVRIPAFSGADDLAGFAPYVRNSDRVSRAGGAGRGARNFLRDVVSNGCCL
jgi:hypothetical protein